MSMTTKPKAIKHTDRSSLAVKLYLTELSTNKIHAPLTVAEEVYLFMEYQLTKDVSIKNKIISSNMKWVITQAKQYITSENKATLEDLISEGNIGLCIAFDLYDINKGVRFLTYAQFHIKNQMRDYINKTLADIPQPANRFIINSYINKSIRRLATYGNDKPSVEQIVDMYNLIKEPEHKILDAYLYAKIKSDKQMFISNSSKLVGNGEDMYIEDILKADDSYRADKILNDDVRKNETKKLLKRILKENEYNIIIHTYGLLDGEAKTPEQIGNITGYTRERVGQLLKVALIKLKEHKSILTSVIA